MDRWYTEVIIWSSGVAMVLEAAKKSTGGLMAISTGTDESKIATSEHKKDSSEMLRKRVSFDAHVHVFATDQHLQLQVRRPATAKHLSRPTTLHTKTLNVLQSTATAI